MLVMLTAKYPATSVRRAIEVFMSPETPKRPGSGREVSSFVHGDHTGYTNYFLIDVDDKSLGEFVRLQAERTIYMETRIPGLSVDMKIGQSVQDAISTAMPHLPR
jgi:hypothetical protein